MFEKTVEYRGCQITVSRERPRDNWYIQVVMKDGTLGYDGWWADSAYKKPGEAIEEAKYGALINKRTQGAGR